MKSVSINTFFDRFTRISFLLFAIFIVVTINVYLNRESVTKAEDTAKILLDQNMAIHTYMNQQLKPAVFKLTDGYRSPDYFDPVWMSSTFAVRSIDRYFNEHQHNFYYKECAVNARSPENEADEVERAFIAELNQNPALDFKSIERIIDGKPYLAVMRRGERMDSSCLRCHSTPDKAPADLVTLFGDKRSFHRKDGDLVSALSVRIPLQEAYSAATRLSFGVSLFVLVVLTLFYAVQHFVMRKMIVLPIISLHNHVREIIRDEEELGQRIIPYLSNTLELRQLIDSFNLMSCRLRKEKDNLVDLVRERTLELEEANKKLRLDMFEMTQMSERQRVLLDAIPNPAWLISLNRKILLQNKAATLFGSNVDDFCWCGIHSCHEIPENERDLFVSTGIPLPGTKCSFCLADDAMVSGQIKSVDVVLNGIIWEVSWNPADCETYLHYAVDVTEKRKHEDVPVQS